MDLYMYEEMGHEQWILPVAPSLWLPRVFYKTNAYYPTEGMALPKE
jgi:hypothetical protein